MFVIAIAKQMPITIKQDKPMILLGYFYCYIFVQINWTTINSLIIVFLHFAKMKMQNDNYNKTTDLINLKNKYPPSH